MTRNDLLTALAEGLKDGGLEAAYNFPGYKSHELFVMCGGELASVNEKIAYETAWGSCLAGKRTMVTFKNVGLNDAADPFINSMLTGVNAGLVLIVFDDTDVEGSQCRFDTRHYSDIYGGLWLEPYDIESAYNLAYQSFQLSEVFGLPVVIRITSQILKQKGKFQKKSLRISGKEFSKNQEQFVVHPVHSKYQLKMLAMKNNAIQKYVNSIYQFDNVKADLKLVFGNCDREIKNTDGIVQIFTYPLPTTLVPLIKAAKSVNIYEQGDQFAAKKVVEISSNTIVKGNSGKRPDNSNGYIITPNYEKLFKAFQNLKDIIITGDLGEYTKDTLNTIDACLCFGSSISVAMGFKSSNPDSSLFSINGDASFLHSGKNVVPELIQRQIKVNIIVIDNGGSQGTGGQPIPGMLRQSYEGLKAFECNYETTTTKEFEKILTKMEDSDCPTILYITKK